MNTHLEKRYRGMNQKVHVSLPILFFASLYRSCVSLLHMVM